MPNPDQPEPKRIDSLFRKSRDFLLDVLPEIALPAEVTGHSQNYGAGRFLAVLHLDVLPQNIQLIADFVGHFAVWKILDDLLADVKCVGPPLLSDGD